MPALKLTVVLGVLIFSSVDIILNTTGGSAPYTFTVNGVRYKRSFAIRSTDSGTTTYGAVTTDGL
jgi:hypothetical protein